MPAAIDLVGKRFGRLVVVSLARAGGRKLGHRLWLCQCDCGSMTRVSTTNLKTCIFSCGCLKRALARTLKPGLRHGMRFTPEYAAWRSMLHRCTSDHNPAWHNYGGRGISVCERWLVFENFFADMGARPDTCELDRIDNDGNYEPGNCRWVTRAVNAKNRRPRERNSHGQYA